MVVAARHTNMLGITTVAGNAPLESTTQNAIVVRDLARHRRRRCTPAPTGRWSPHPRHAGYVHGESGLDGAQLPPPSGPPASRDAIGVHHRDGPQQRRRVAGAHRPDDQHRPGAALGARHRRRESPASRSWAAACSATAQPPPSSTSGQTPRPPRSCVGYGGPLIMAGLDVTYQLQATPERIEQVRQLPGRLAADARRPDDVLQWHLRQPPREHSRRRRARPAGSDGADPSRSLHQIVLACRRRDRRRAHARHDRDRSANPDRPTGAELRSADQRRRRRGMGSRDSRPSPTSAAELGSSTAPQIAGERTTVAAMRAAVMRDWQLRVDDLPDPTPGAGSGADQGVGVRDLRQRSAPAATRRGEPAGDERVERRPATRPDADDRLRARARHRDGP